MEGLANWKHGCTWEANEKVGLGEIPFFGRAVHLHGYTWEANEKVSLTEISLLGRAGQQKAWLYLGS